MGEAEADELLDPENFEQLPNLVLTASEEDRAPRPAAVSAEGSSPLCSAVLESLAAAQPANSPSFVDRLLEFPLNPRQPSWAEPPKENLGHKRGLPSSQHPSGESHAGEAGPQGLALSGALTWRSGAPIARRRTSLPRKLAASSGSRPETPASLPLVLAQRRAPLLPDSHPECCGLQKPPLPLQSWQGPRIDSRDQLSGPAFQSQVLKLSALQGTHAEGAGAFALEGTSHIKRGCTYRLYLW
ncbi:uncharacterized protein LOC127545114 [Antechinus flavipes]|uniref:uncharacterized protein LOC127545114 n=1 Tax=Antechinus flavipes TaxID=38775 RepID=UPI0022358916|nr:uncharacterized protein LOC127545114 [Antechinus flavipes]